MLTLVKDKLQGRSPGVLLILYYAVAIALGSLALATPWASTGDPLPLIDALFTATSAQCVTGLVVVDTGTALSGFGQLVVLMLIQIGGLGITTFSVYLFFYFRLGVGLRGRWIIHETLLHSPVDSMKDLVRGILLVTLIIEGLGAVLLAFAFVPDLGLLPGFYTAIFTSVSAFCNAGFALFSDSLVGYRDSSLVNLTVMALIILGGLGFLVIRELFDLMRNRGHKRLRLSLHSRLVLWTSGALIVGGAVLFRLLEGSCAFQGMSVGETFWSALFQSVSARTSGFNTIDLNTMGAASLLLMIFLMFVGASPGSCGGGIKTTSLAVFVAILHSRLKGSAHTNVFRRTIPDEAVTKTLSLVMLAALIVCGATFALLAVQLPSTALSESGAVFMDYAFEAVSAFATVGLSLGMTGKLTVLGKLIIIALMFVGRVGLLTVAFAIVRRSHRQEARYSEENIMIG